MAKQSHMKSIFNNVSNIGKKLVSLELYSNREVDWKLLNELNPSFCSFTWNGGDLSKPHELPTISLGRKLLENSTNMVMHVGGRNFKREDAVNIVNVIKEMGVKNILALQGASSNKDDSTCEYPYAIDFLRFLREEYGDHFNIATSGYPIGHPSAADPVKDIDYLKKKVDVGADFIMCQAVYDVQTFKTFQRRCRELNITIPIIPAVYAINSYDLLKNLMGFTKVVPEDYLKNMEKYKDDEEAITNYSVDYLSKLIKSLLTDKEISAPGVHLYCFNNLTLVGKIFAKLDFDELKIWQPTKNEQTKL